MLPFDLLGGFLLPHRFGRSSSAIGSSFLRWLAGVLLQAVLFLLTSATILTAGRLAGLPGTIVVITVIAFGYVALQRKLAISMTRGQWCVNDDKVGRAMKRAKQWGLNPLPVTVVHHSDRGFTGGVVGLPQFASIIVSRDWVDQLTAEQLAVALARRLEAVESGSRTRGMLLALIWILAGFTLSALLPGAGVRSVAELVMTCMGFTGWTFLGLLILPTVSRQSSHAIDRDILRRGARSETLSDTLQILDRFQDDEQSRPALIEWIFHPVPSVENRRVISGEGEPIAWHTARMTLFLSWSCMGLLARAVHCNVGRPELWVMLPTD